MASLATYYRILVKFISSVFTGYFCHTLFVVILRISFDVLYNLIRYTLKGQVSFINNELSFNS